MESTGFEIYLHPELNCNFHRDDVHETRACATAFFLQRTPIQNFADGHHLYVTHSFSPRQEP